MTQPIDENPHKLIGQTIQGKYQVVKLLGEGGMGCVYEAHQRLGDTIRKVAVKTLHPHLSHDPKIIARFEREVGTVAALTHPNTIQVYDFGKTDDGTLYIAMEFVEGRSVADVLEKDGPMPPERVVKILEQVAGSLEEAHAHGIIHRDLKPDNIVLCDKAGQKDWVEVLDFGIAKRGSETDPNEQKLTQQGMVLGTPPYMSPEQFTGQPIDKRSDVYALGVMAYEMLTGRLPFSGSTAWEWATAHMTAQPTPIESQPLGSAVPVPMKEAIKRALEKDREKRWGSVREFVDALAGKHAAVLPAGASADAGAMSGRGKTEMGVPISPPYGSPQSPPYGAPQAGGTQPGMVAMGPPPVAPAHYGTPSAGNHALPAAPPPPREQKKGNTGLILGVLGVVAVIAIVGILAGLGVFKGKPKPDEPLVLGTGTSVPTVNLTQSTATATPTATDTATSEPLPTLGTRPPPPPPLNTKPTGTGTGTAKPTTTGTTANPPTTTAPPPPTTTYTPPPPPPQGNPNAPGCQQARQFCAMGRAAMCAKYTQDCRAAGGRL
jgi:serine/threonine-protein kinase